MTSCSEEDIFNGQAGDVVTFNVSIPELATRAAGDGTSANKLYWGVYDHNDKLLSSISNTTEGKVFIGSDNVKLTLAKDRSYSVIFWAANNDNSMCNVNWTERKMTVSPTNANQESYDAFCAYVPIENVSGYMTRDIKLSRPFAQINIGTADVEEAEKSGLIVENTKVTIEGLPVSYNFADGTTEENCTFTYEYPSQATSFDNESFPVDGYEYLAMNYALVSRDKELVDITFTYKDNEDKEHSRSFSSVPVQRNYRTNIYGNILTGDADYNVEILPGFDAEYNDDKSVVVNSAETFVEAFEEAVSGEGVNVIVLGDDIDLNDLFGGSNAPATRAAGDDPSLTIAAEKELTIDLNGKKLSATSTQTGKNYNMFNVRGTLTMKNGTIEYKHEGENMEWNNSTNLFDVTAGGVLNLEGITAKNLGGSDMAFVAHLNNWGEVTLNVDNSTLESNYVPVRVFNSGNDMNNVTIKKSTLKGGSYAFWVHNYTVDDFGTEAKAEAQKALLNLNIYNQGNTFSPDLNGIRYGFTNSVKADAYGITKTVSEDGTVVTLGSVIENALVRRGVAGAEENQTIKKVVVEEGIATLYDRTFRRYYALEEVVLPSTLTTIGAAGSGVFQSCTNLKKIVLPENVIVLGKGSFQECSSLESINIPAGVTRIESDALHATGLKSVEFHAGVTYFGAQAFRDCKQLTEVIINAPEFTMEGNTFGIMAAPFTPMTIYVKNAAMKAYVESKLTAHAKTYITVYAPTEVSDVETLSKALANGENVTLTADIAVGKNETGSNGYGATGINQLNGGVIDGNGHAISVKAWGTWDSAINTTGGTIKNLNVTGGMRGIFVNHNSSYSDKVILDNVTINGTIYTISCDQGTEKGLEAYNSTFNGWTSYAATIGVVKFDGCSFGEGQGYAFCRPYAPTEFVNCNFAEGYKLDAVAKVTFENCTIGGIALTAENLSTLVTSNTANATVK